MIVGPGDRSCKRVVRNTSGNIRLRMFRMKEMRAADPAERAQGSSQVLVIASGHDAATSLAETRNALTVCHAQAVAGVDCKQPKLVEIRLIECGEDWIVAGGICLAIARCHFAERIAGAVFERRQFISQKRESLDMPIVFVKGNGGLQQNPDW